MRAATRLLFIVFVAGCGGGAPAATSSLAPPRTGPAPELEWEEWGEAPFRRAREEGKPILLSVRAGWCHFCHVMDEETFGDEEVRRWLAARFVLVRADGDARPDLAERYRRYAWPATVFLSSEGEHIAGLRGFRPPEAFLTLVERVLVAHAAGERLEDTQRATSSPDADLSATRARLVAQLDGFYDEGAAGWGRRQRYPLGAPVEHAFFRARVEGDRRWRRRALASLERYASLIDPEWGGVYQYSVAGVWDRPHFEKIVPVQAGAMRAFAAAFQETGDERWRAHAEAVDRYVREWLTAPDGAFYASQDADLGGAGQSGPHMEGAEFYALSDEARRALGAPRVDTRIFANENGRLVSALARLSRATGETEPLTRATRAAERVLESHLDEGTGLFRHEASGDDPLRYLSDQAHMLEGLVALHQASGERRWLERARALADATLEHLADPEGGLFAHTEDPAAVGVFRDRPRPAVDGGVAAGALLDLGRLLHEPRYVEAAARALRAAAHPQRTAPLGRLIGELVLTLARFDTSYAVLSVVGPETEATAALFEAARRSPDPRVLVDLNRPGEGQYPYPGQPAIFICTDDACSMPVTDPAALSAALEAFLGDS